MPLFKFISRLIDDEDPVIVMPFGGYANAFSADLSQYGPGETVEVIANRTDLNPNAYAMHVLKWVEAGATIVGGCCQTEPAHIAEIKRLLMAAGHDL